MRLFMSTVALGLQPFTYWPGSGGGSAASAGEAQPGNARCAHHGSSGVTGGYGLGFLSLCSNRGSLHHIGSSNTFMLGHSQMLERPTGVTFPQTTKWLSQSGSITTSAVSGALSIVFVPSYSTTTLLTIMLSHDGDIAGVNATSWTVNIQDGSIATSGFSSFFSKAGAGISALKLNWIAEGLAST